MSHQDSIKEPLHFLYDRTEPCENSSLNTSKSSDSEDNTVAHLFDSPNKPRSADDSDSTSEALDPNNRIIPAALVDPRAEVADTTVLLSPDFPESTCESNCGLSDLDDVSMTTSEMFPFLRAPTGFAGYRATYYRLTGKLRDKGYLFPFELVYLAFTITCCYIGAFYWLSCPANAYIPRYVFFNGAIASFSVCLEIMDSLWKLVMIRVDTTDYRRYLYAFGLYWVALITNVMEMSEFYTMSYSFDRSEENYCNETFYWFVFYKNIALGVSVFLTAMIYIPSFDFDYRFRYV